MVWLSGVRRVGKTVLCQSLDDVEYFDCELPRTRRDMADTEAFWQRLRGRRVVLDEVHRLANPSELLKIAADHFADTRVVATGSSRLQASAKFRDTLTGRKTELWLTPMLSPDLVDFGNADVTHRLRNGGLPPFFLAGEPPEADFQEWMDSYWAKDIQELFRLERRMSFQRLVELLLSNSGGVFEATKYAGPCEVSRTTVANYLAVLDATRVVSVIAPFSTHRPTEIVKSPKIYAFDTGFVRYYSGWTELRPQDLGILWEHFVLNEVQGRLAAPFDVRYWRDTHGHEVDFVVVRHGRPPIAVECKWSASPGSDLAGIRAFRRRYPEGDNLIVCQDVERSFARTDGDLAIEYLGLEGLIDRLSA